MTSLVTNLNSSRTGNFKLGHDCRRRERLHRRRDSTQQSRRRRRWVLGLIFYQLSSGVVVDAGRKSAASAAAAAVTVQQRLSRTDCQSVKLAAVVVMVVLTMDATVSSPTNLSLCLPTYFVIYTRESGDNGNQAKRPAGLTQSIKYEQDTDIK